MRIYVEIAFINVDYVQPGKSSHSSGHSSSAFCTMCAVRCLGVAAAGTAGSKHTTISAPPDLRITRSLERLMALRRRHLSASEHNFLGLQKSGKEAPASCLDEAGSDTAVLRSIAPILPPLSPLAEGEPTSGFETDRGISGASTIRHACLGVGEYAPIFFSRSAILRSGDSSPRSSLVNSAASCYLRSPKPCESPKLTRKVS